MLKFVESTTDLVNLTEKKCCSLTFSPLNFVYSGTGEIFVKKYTKIDRSGNFY